MSVSYLVAAQAIYTFGLRPRGIRNSLEFSGALRTYELGAAKYGNRGGPTNQLQSNFDLRLSGLASTPENCSSRMPLCTAYRVSVPTKVLIV